MMKKSSLGRRSSTTLHGRASFMNSSKFSEQRSGIPKFAGSYSTTKAKAARPSSVDRDLNSSRRNVPMPGTMRRSKSQLSFDRLSTSSMVTPLPQRAKGPSYGGRQSEGGNRPSSMGLKSVKKDTRPIAEKSFLDAETGKVLDFIRENFTDGEISLNLKTNSRSKFAVLIDSLVSIHGLRITNFVPEEIIKCANVLQYRGKMDKNMLQTVNAPHTWPSFLPFLSWLVDLYHVTKALNPQEVLYPEIENADIASEEIDDQLPLWVPHLMEGYTLHRNDKDDIPEMQKFFVEYKKKLNINEQKIVELQQKYNTNLAELNNSGDAADVKELTELKEQCEKLIKDINEIKQYICNSEEYVQQLNENCQKYIENINQLERTIELRNKEKLEIEKKIAAQSMSREEKDKMLSDISQLERGIKQIREEINAYKDAKYNEEIELVKKRTLLDKSISEFNKLIVLNSVMMTELQNLEINEVVSLANKESVDQKYIDLKSSLQTLKDDMKKHMKMIDDDWNNTKIETDKNKNVLSKLKNKCDSVRKNIKSIEKEITAVKDTVQKDKEETDRRVQEMENKIAKEKKMNEELFGELTEEKTLEDITKKREKFVKDAEDYKRITTEHLEVRLNDMKGYKAEMDEVVAKANAEREEIIKKALSRLL